MATPSPSQATPILVHDLLINARQVDPEFNCLIRFGVEGLVLITDTVNNAILHTHAIPQLKSRHMQEIIAAYFEATIKAEKAALNLDNAVAMSLCELDLLRTALGHVNMPSKLRTSVWTFNRWDRWFKKADVKKALQELEKVDPSTLVLPATLLTDFEDAMAAYDMVVELCKKRRRRSLRKRATAKAVQIACTASVIVLSVLRVGLTVLAVAAGVVTSGISAGSSRVADGILKELIDTLNLKIGAVDAKREVLRDAQTEALNLHVDIRKIKLELGVLQGEQRDLSRKVQQARRLDSLSSLLEAQAQEELLKQHDNLTQLKASCANLIRSILQAYDSFKKHSAIIE